jgi:hypothetical protein
MRKINFQLCFLISCIFLVSFLYLGCQTEENGRPGNLPYGQYKSTFFPSVILRDNGTFYIEHEANADDSKAYTIEGTFTFTTEVVDPDNDTYGKIDLNCTSLTVNGSGATEIVGTFCDEAQFCTEPTLNDDDTLLGWWSYSDNITWGGKMRIWLNYPPDLRAGSPFSGSRSLLSVDPV